MVNEAATAATIGDEAELVAIVAPVVEEAHAVDVPVVAQTAVATKKAKPELTAEQRAIESKKRADRHRALEQRKKDDDALEQRHRVAEQLQLLQTKAKAKAMQEHAMLFYSHTALAQLAATGTDSSSAGRSGSSVTRPLPPRSTTPPTAPFGYPPGTHEMMVLAGRVIVPAGWVTEGGRVHDRVVAFVH
jgi:hypothetical protein